VTPKKKHIEIHAKISLRYILFALGIAMLVNGLYLLDRLLA
jgi:hypothetical protein